MLILYLRCSCRHARELYVSGVFLHNPLAALNLIEHVATMPCPRCETPQRKAQRGFDPDVALGDTVVLPLC